MRGAQQARWLVSALIAALVAGCASGPQVRNSQSAAERRDSAAHDTTAQEAPTIAPVVWEEPAQLPVPPADSAEAIPTPPQDMPQPLALSLFDAVEMGLAQNPDLIALRTAEGVSEGKIGRASCRERV